MPFNHERYVTHEQLERVLNERLENVASQADIDTITAGLNQVAADLAASSSTLQAEIDSLAAANPQLDLTALQAAAAPLDAAAQKIGTLVPDAPAPAPSPAPSPSPGG